ncbi:ABC transporter permease [Devosia sp. PTR5]|uniref:ABC transporter permease n=1 Tax=Devosia oryzisoli TaxID=2774138 RepID=A0A927IQT2_9HYPH|nr:ABC transporter permease [Devosia oryzisoli]MBD8065970.1 ABC transporter permease [Devosia oryzisoli]
MKMPVLTRIAVSFLVLIAFCAVFANFLAPLDPLHTNLLARLKPPVFAGGTWANWLGTDELGRDTFSRLLYALRTSLLIAAIGTAIGAIIGTTLGFTAAHFRGATEQIIMAAVDFQAAVPFIILVMFVLAVLGNSMVVFLVLIGFAGWEVYTRLARGLVLSARQRNYVMALEGLEMSWPTIYARHVLPNIASAIIVQLTLNFPATILLETGLSFLGLGVQPPDTSLGLMLGEGRNYLLQAWWLSVLPGLAIFFTTLSMSILGDWLRDRLDPLSQAR